MYFYLWLGIRTQQRYFLHTCLLLAIFEGDIIGDTSREVLLEKIRQNVEDKDIDSVFQTYISKQMI